MVRQVEVRQKNGAVVESRALRQGSDVVPATGKVAIKVSGMRADVAAMERHGGDLVMRFKDGSVLVLKGYFACTPGEEPELAIAEPGDGGVWKLQLDDATCVAGKGAVGEALPYSFSPVTDAGLAEAGASGFGIDQGGGGVGALPIGLGALAAGGAAAAAGGGSSGGGGGGGGNPTPPADTTPPGVPTIQPTNGAVIRGTAEANARVNIDLGGNGSVDATVTADASGNWTYTPAAPLPHGTTLTVTATDAAGNTSGPATATVDAAPPPAPAIGAVTDDLGAITGAVARGGATDDTRPAISGSGTEPNATVSVFDNGALLGTTTADASGNWTFTPPNPLGEGAHNFTASAADALGNASAASPGYAITVDTTAPAAPVIAPTDGGRVSGAAEAGTSVRLDLDGNGSVDATVPVDGSGAWTFTPAAPLPDGATVSAVAVDAAGNASPAATAIVDVDLPPPAPAIGAVTDDVGAVTGAVADGGRTDDARPAISGMNAEPNATITVFDNGAAIGTTTADGSGAWSFTPTTALGEGAHSFTATATDAQGNASAQSAPHAITVDLSAPAVPTIGAVTDDAAPGIGAVANGGSTNDVTPAVSGSGAEANAIITVFDNGVAIGTTTANGSGAWSFTPTTALAAGPHSFTVTARDVAGNASAQSAAYAVTIDLTPPAVPAIASVSDNAGPVTGIVANGGATDDTTPAIAGGGVEAGAIVTVSDNGVALGSVAADGSGAWSFTPATALAAGPHSFTVTATDAQGNASAPSAAYAITVDLAPPAAPGIDSVSDDAGIVTGIIANGGATDDVTPAISGSGAEADATITVFDNGVAIGTTTADGAGAWSFTPTPPLVAGAHSFTVTATDAQGNASAPSAAYAVTVDLAAPAAVVEITALTVDTGAPGDFVTEDASPTISGTLSAPLGAGEEVQVRLDGSGPWITATATGTAWFHGFGAVPVGAHTVEARVVDAVGNIGSVDSQGFTITAETNQPPMVQVDETMLLGVLSAEALDVIDLNDQSLVAVDPDNNLESVVVLFAPLVNLGNATLTASDALAAELGLDIGIVNDPGILGILAPSSELTITAIGGGAMNNQAVNELLATVHFEQNVLGISAQVLAATTITATDTEGQSATATAGTLAGASLLQTTGDSTIIFGTAQGETLTGLDASERLYGFGGDDTIDGGGGDDLLRGGQGADVLIGGLGDDVLIHDALDLSVDGGDGFDTLLVEGGGTLALNAGAPSITNIERVDLGVADPGVDLALTEAGVLAANADGELYVTGDAADTVTLAGATLEGQVLVGETAYNQYALGAATVFIETSVVVG